MRCIITLSFIFLLQTLVVSQVPTPSILVSPSVLCSGQTATFTSLSSTVTPNDVVWSISPGTGVTYLSANTSTNLVVSFANAGRFVIGLTWDFGGLGTSTKTISTNVVKSANASFNASVSNSGFPADLNLTNYSSNSTKNYWVFDNNFSLKDSLVNTTKSYSAPGNYTVLLVALGSFGCNDSSSYNFSIAGSSTFTLPNVFSPNGDGINERFRPIADGISSLHVSIYNRLGTLVYEWTKVNGFWDGTSTSGLACDAGDYFVIAEATGFDGISHTAKGTLTLVR